MNYAKPQQMNTDETPQPMVFYDPTQFAQNVSTANAVPTSGQMPYYVPSAGSASNNWDSSWNEQWDDNWQAPDAADPMQYMNTYGMPSDYHPGGDSGAQVMGQWPPGTVNPVDIQNQMQQYYYDPNTGAHYDPQLYGSYNTAPEQASNYPPYNPADGYFTGTLQSMDHAESMQSNAVQSQLQEHGGTQVEPIARKDDSLQPHGEYGTETKTASAAVSEPLPTVSSFAGSLDQPSPFDSIVGNSGLNSSSKEDQQLAVNHSRNSSCGGVHFVLGGSENTSECASHSNSPHGFVRDTNLSKAETVRGPPPSDLRDASVELNTASHLVAASKSNVTEGATNSPYVASAPPKSMPSPGTMAGTPTGNQYRKSANVSNNNNSSRLSNVHLHEDRSHLGAGSGFSGYSQPRNPLQTTSSGAGSHHEHGYHDDSHSLQQNVPVWDNTNTGLGSATMESGEKVHVNFFGSSAVPHAETSFTPVGGGHHHIGNMGQKASYHDSAPHTSSCYEQESSASESGRLDTDEIESDALLDSGNGESSICPTYHSTGTSDGDRRTTVMPGTDAVFMGASRINSGHKVRRENTLSPAATLWENPEPPVVQLVPAGVTDSRIDTKHRDIRPVVPDFLQNTGTGPSNSGAPAGQQSFGGDSHASVVAAADQQIPLAPANRQVSDQSSQLPALQSFDNSNTGNVASPDELVGNVQGHATPAVGTSNSQDTVSRIDSSFQPTQQATVSNMQPSNKVDQNQFVGPTEAGAVLADPLQKDTGPSSELATAGSSASVADVPSRTKTAGVFPNEDSSPGFAHVQRTRSEVPLTGSRASGINIDHAVAASGKGPHQGSASGDIRNLNSTQSQLHLPNDAGKPNSECQPSVKHNPLEPAYADLQGHPEAVHQNQAKHEATSLMEKNQIHGRANPVDKETDRQSNRPISHQDSDNSRYEQHRSQQDYDDGFNRSKALLHRDDDSSQQDSSYRQDRDYRSSQDESFRKGYGDQREGDDEHNRSRYEERRGEVSDRYDHGERRYDRPLSRQEASDRYEREERRGGRPHSRQEASERHERDERRGERPSSRQEPIDRYERSQGWQGYEDDRYGRPSSRQEYYDRSGRPPSRQNDDRRINRADYHDRPRSRQDDPYLSRPRPNYEDRPRSRQGFGEDSNRSFHQAQPPNRERPGSRQDYYPDERGHRNDYDKPYERQPYSREAYNDPHNRSYSRGRPDSRYNEEDRQRPRSRQDDRSSTSGESGWKRQSENNDKSRPNWNRSYSDYDDQRGGYDYHRNYGQYRDDRYYYDQYGYNYYQDPYTQYQMDYGAYMNPYYKGYYAEFGDYQRPYDARYDDGRYNGTASLHSSTRASIEDLSAADHFAQTSRNNSRPSSVLSGRPESVISNSREPLYPTYDDRISYAPAAIPVAEPVVPRRMTPHKFIIPHARASFGTAGQLIHILPTLPADGQPALVEIIDLPELLSHSQEAEKLKAFPGPLVRVETHKNDVLHYCQRMILLCRNDVNLVDRASAELLWRFLELLIKQNGMLIGTDIADLLLEGHEPTARSFSRGPMTSMALSTFDAGQTPDTSQDFYNSATTSGRSSVVREISPSDNVEVMDRFRHLLLHGRKKDALEWAMKRNLWGHALYLSSKMDAKTQSSVATRFANASMKFSDPLQTLYQIMSGRQPTASTMAVEEKWGDWRPHLAIILSNPTSRPEVDRRSITTLGDTLASKGLLFGSQFCYLVVSMMMSRDEGGIGLFGTHATKSSKLVLIGASHSSPFEEFISNLVAIQCTEVYEYSMSLGNPYFLLPSFQMYRFLYVLKLIDNGLVEEALRYVEVLSRVISSSPHLFSLPMALAVYHLADKLRSIDYQRLAPEEIAGNPEWMQYLLGVIQAMREGRIVQQPSATPNGGSVPSQQPDGRFQSGQLSGNGTLNVGSGEAGDSSSVGQLASFGSQQFQTISDSSSSLWTQSSSSAATQVPAATPASTMLADAHAAQPSHQENTGVSSVGFPHAPHASSAFQSVVSSASVPSTITSNAQDSVPYGIQQPIYYYQHASNTAEPVAYQGVHGLAQPTQTAADFPDGQVHHHNAEQSAWNAYQPMLQPVPEAQPVPPETTGYIAAHPQTGGEINSMSGGPLTFNAHANNSGQGSTVPFTQSAHYSAPTVPNVFNFAAPSGPPPMTGRSGSRHRTTSSSSSTSQGPGSRRNSLGPSSARDPSLPGTPAATQASSPESSSPRDSSQSVSSQSLHASRSSVLNTNVTTASAAADADSGGSLFQFGLPPPRSPVYTADTSNAPLGVNPDQKKKQYWPGEELDEDKANKENKPTRSIDKGNGKPKDNKGWFSWFSGQKNRPKEMKLPDDKNPTIIWDPVKNRYVNTEEDNENDGTDTKEAPPPTDTEVQQKLQPPSAARGPIARRGTFNRIKVAGPRGQYVDVLSGASKPAVAAPSSLFSVLPKSASMPASIFVPNAQAANTEQGDSNDPNPNLVEGKPELHQPELTSTPNMASAEVEQNLMPPVPVPNQPLTQPTVPSAAATVGPILPQMFNPAQFRQPTTNSNHPAAAAGTGLHYGQRRQYPRQ